MAASGPAPRPGHGQRPDRTDVLEWVEVPDLPFEAGRLRGLPEDLNLCKRTIKWWNIIREMPHAITFAESDWAFAEDLVLIKDKFYRGELADSALSEMRRREDQLGTTVEARRKNRIRYVQPKAPAATTPAQAAAPGTVTPIDRRARLLAE